VLKAVVGKAIVIEKREKNRGLKREWTGGGKKLWKNANKRVSQKEWQKIKKEKERVRRLDCTKTGRSASSGGPEERIVWCRMQKKTPCGNRRDGGGKKALDT